VAGDYDRARTLYTNAKDLDPMPWRVLTDFNQAIRRLAELDGVFLVDVEKSFQKQAVHGLVGFSLVADNCHPTPLGNAIIAREILTLMKQKRQFVEKDLGLSIGDSLEHFLLQTTTPGKRQSLEMRYLLSNAKYSMKTPFYNFKASRMYLDKALAMDSSNWEVWVNLATLSFFESRIEEGQQQLRRATQLHGAPIDRNDRRYAPYLKEALEQSGK
jgi:tetratricopeptide (TPR) repeat protein